MLCSDQEFINVSHEKIYIKIEIAIFSKIKSKSIENRHHTTGKAKLNYNKVQLPT